ncbi:HupE/UreJ family protein [Ruegeria sp. HKCCA5491]|uniref:HupE/UreJ family protein n=1 Tax=Ruegeria sp. HKCCA5491 TaxID=2682986 RepID=UPI00148767DE|nr:HupE/UreJ family protein [Ruegeria sp. HKCCA5491]
MRFAIRFAVLVLSYLSVAGGAWAHFNLNQNVRIFHIVRNDSGLNVMLRTPMAYVLADKVGPAGTDGLPRPAPFTTNELQDGVVMHLVDVEALRRAPFALADIVLNELVIEQADGRLQGHIVNLKVYPIGQEPGFATKAEATEALAATAINIGSDQQVYVGDTVVDIWLTFGDASDAAYALSMLSNPGLAGQDETANLILNYHNGETQTYRAKGLLAEPIEITGTASSAAATFVVEGVRHIIEGIDHVLFVLCMVIGSLNLKALLARVTGFTLGHSVTLIMGFFGLAPSAPWFIPAVETAIAMTIILAAADAVFQRSGGKHSYLVAAGVTAGVGLLHGFGFSFMLREILKVDADNVWQSLLAFNVGVEIGQLMIVLVTWPLVVILRRMPTSVWIGARAFIAASISVVALIWVVERFSLLIT